MSHGGGDKRSASADAESNGKRYDSRGGDPCYITPQQLRARFSELTFVPRESKDTSKGVTIDVKLNNQPVFVKLGDWDDEGLGSSDAARRQRALDLLAVITTPFHYKDTILENGVPKQQYDQLLKIQVSDDDIAVFEELSNIYRNALFNMQKVAFPGKKVYTDTQKFREEVRFKSLVDEEADGRKFVRVKGSFNRMQTEEPPQQQQGGKPRWVPKPTKYYVLNPSTGELEEGAHLQDFKIGSKVTIGVRLNGFHCSDGQGKPTLKITMMGGIVPANASFAQNPQALFGAGARVVVKQQDYIDVYTSNHINHNDDVGWEAPPADSDNDDAPLDHM